MIASKKGFQRKKVEALTLGERLYKMRKENHVSMAEFAKHTKIQVKYLRALEEGLYDKLPSVVYIKGFLRAYEHFFDLADGVLLTIFDREYRIYSNIHQEKHPDKEGDVARVQKMPRMIITPKVLMSFIALLMFVSIGGYLYYGVNQFVSAPWIAIAEPLNGIRTDAQTVMVRGTTHPDARLSIGGKNIFVDRDGVFQEHVGLVPGENVIVIRSTNATDKASERVLKIFSTYTPVRVAEDTQEYIQDGIEMTITVLEEATWIAITADDIEVFSATLPPESTQTFHAQKNIRVTAGKGNQVGIVINGEDQGVLAEDVGMVRDVLFEAAPVSANVLIPEEATVGGTVREEE